MSNNTYINMAKGKYTARSFQQNNACPPLPQIKEETLKTQEKVRRIQQKDLVSC